MLIGYARVSTEEQNEARQIEALKARGAERIFCDKTSGKNKDRPELQSMLTFCREGDTVITESISRISRSARDLFSIIDELNLKRVEFVSMKESIDTTTPQGRFVLSVFGALSELERENMLQRQREGIEIAKKAGKYKGRKPILTDEKALRAICKEWRAGNITGVEAARRAGLKKGTFYKRVKELGL